MSTSQPIKAFFMSMIALTLIAGCSSSGRMSESEDAVESFRATNAKIAAASAEVDATLASMSQLSAGGDLEKSFKNFSKQVETLEKTGQNARKRAQSMRDNVDAYVKEWQKETATMQDPSIKASLDERRQAFRSNFEKVKVAAEDARAAYDPFLRRLKEIQRALSIDLTMANVNGLKPAMESAKTEGQVVKRELQALQLELDRIAGGMSPTKSSGSKG